MSSAHCFLLHLVSLLSHRLLLPVLGRRSDLGTGKVDYSFIVTNRITLLQALHTISSELRACIQAGAFGHSPATPGAHRTGRGKGSSLTSAFLTPKPPASSVYVHVPEARCPHKRSISVTSLFSLFVAVHHLGPLLLCPKEACQAMGLGRVRNGQSQDEDQGGAGGKHRVQHRRSSASGARSIHSCLARGLGREGA